MFRVEEFLEKEEEEEEEEVDWNRVINQTLVCLFMRRRKGQQ